MEIRYVDYAIANNFGTYIELNQGLKMYPGLHDFILKHELAHTQREGFNKDDFLLDISSTEYSLKDMIKFMINNPSALWQFLPFYKKKGIIFYDINMIIIWSLIIGFLGIGTYLGLTL